MNRQLKAPFPYFGGKSSIAAEVWRALGQPKHYIEPFFGSGAVLLARPNYKPQTHIETVNDADGHVCNVWRSLQFSPDLTARWCDWPVNHADLSARKLSLIANESRLLDNLIADPDWHDPKMAGYWIWAASCWIGSGLTIISQIPQVGNAGIGVHKIGKRPHLGDAGIGVHAIGQRPHLGNAGIGVQEPYNTNIYKWFRQLSERLRYVRVVCGDWTRVCGGDWQDKHGDVGIFMDPPYGHVATRKENLYAKDSLDVAQAVQEWCLERGMRQSYRIVLAGYYEEHERLLEHGWRVRRWRARGGYGNTSQNDKQDNPGKVNRKREALFMSPHCRKIDLGL
jgi:site-specific DNA-adenine methylase